MALYMFIRTDYVILGARRVAARVGAMKPATVSSTGSSQFGWYAGFQMAILLCEERSDLCRLL